MNNNKELWYHLCNETNSLLNQITKKLKEHGQEQEEAAVDFKGLDFQTIFFLLSANCIRLKKENNVLFSVSLYLIVRLSEFMGHGNYFLRLFNLGDSKKIYSVKLTIAEWNLILGHLFYNQDILTEFHNDNKNHFLTDEAFNDIYDAITSSLKKVILLPGKSTLIKDSVLKNLKSPVSK